MKIKYILPALGMMALFASCDQNKGTSSMPADATAADSLAFYLGQYNGEKYRNAAQYDTIFNTPEAKKAFLEGVSAALNLPRQDQEAFNQGLSMGFNVAMKLNSFEKTYSTPVNKQLFLQSLTAVLMNDSVSVSVPKVETEMQKIITTFQQQKDEADHQKAKESLSAEAAGKDLPKITDDLYGKITLKNDSAKIKEGDLVNIQLTATNMQGEPVNVPFPKVGRVGARNVNKVLSDALCHLKSGEEGEFLTSVNALLGPRAEQYRLEPSDIIKFQLKASLQPEKDKPSKDDDD